MAIARPPEARVSVDPLRPPLATTLTMPTPKQPTGVPPSPAVRPVAETLVRHAPADDRTHSDNPGDVRSNCRHLAVAYVDGLAQVPSDKEGVSAMMQQFGGHLLREGVRPEHIVICAREAIQHDRCREGIQQWHVREQAIASCIQGYYLERGRSQA